MRMPTQRRSANVAVHRRARPAVAAILPDLLIGEYPTPEDVEWLRTGFGVTAVLSLQDDADLAGKRLELRELARAYRTHGVGFHRVPVPDCDVRTQAAQLDAIVALLGELLRAGHRVYLHCNGGTNRAPTVAIAYLHTHQGLALAAARDFVKQRRHCVPYMQLLHARYEGRNPQ
jgi:protein-tyrosine phosphatase